MIGDLDLAAALRRRGIRDERVLGAIGSLRRADFVPEPQREQSQADAPAPIGFGQTISQPYVVALMTEALAVEPGMRVLEVGTGSGYQAAVLARLGAQVWSVERIAELAARARRVFAHLELAQVRGRVGDGSRGWPEEAPFDRIIVTAAAARTPGRLVEQLANGGRLIAPIGAHEGNQELVVIDRSAEGKLSWRSLLTVQFVPLVEGTESPTA